MAGPASALSAVKRGSLGQTAGPDYSCLGLHLWGGGGGGGGTPPGQEHHPWEEGLLGQLHLQDDPSAQVACDSLQLDMRQKQLGRAVCPL